MRTIELYRKHKAGEISRDKFIYEVRRDKNLPWVTNLTSFDDAVKILKNKGIISEAEIIENYEVHLKEVDNNVPTDPAVNRVNPYYLKKGVQKLLDKEKELTNDSYINALNKAAKQLEANPHAFDEDMFANAKEVEKEDAKLQTQEVKKDNHVDKNREMKKVKVKALKEAVLKELTDSLKKKEQINEDIHWKHNVGSEVHTPDGPGKVSEIAGSTLTIEMEDGSLRDYQINTVDHFTQEALDKESEKEAEPSNDDVKDMWRKWDKKGEKTFGGMVVDPTYQSDLDKKYGKLKEYIAQNKHDKEKMGKLKDKLKELVKVKDDEGEVVKLSGSSADAQKFVNSQPSNVKSKLKITGK